MSNAQRLKNALEKRQERGNFQGEYYVLCLTFDTECRQVLDLVKHYTEISVPNRSFLFLNAREYCFKLLKHGVERAEEYVLNSLTAKQYTGKADLIDAFASVGQDWEKFILNFCLFLEGLENE